MLFRSVDWWCSLAVNQPDSRGMSKERSFSAKSASIGVAACGIDSTAAAASFGGVSGKTPAPWIEVNAVEEGETGNRRGIAMGVDWRRSLVVNLPLRRETPKEGEISWEISLS